MVPIYIWAWEAGQSDLPILGNSHCLYGRQLHRCLGRSFGSSTPCSSRYASRACKLLHVCKGSHVVSPRFHLMWNSSLFRVHLWPIILSTNHSVLGSVPKS